MNCNGSHRSSERTLAEVRTDCESVVFMVVRIAGIRKISNPIVTTAFNKNQNINASLSG